MPRSKAAEKAVRSGERRRLRNRAVKSMTKTTLTKAEKALASGDSEAAQSAIALSIKTLDKAAKKGVIHPNMANRRKSRLTKRLNKVVASKAVKESPAEPEAESEE